MPENLPEPWMRGPLQGIEPCVMPVFFTFQQVREDVPHLLSGLTTEQIWLRLHGAASLGYHIKHMAGSADRLSTYLVGQELTREQFAYLQQEDTADLDSVALEALLIRELERVEARLRQVSPESLYEPRAVGRKKLPTTALGLLVHISEHTQRHLGQATTTAKMLRYLAAHEAG